MKGCDSMKRDLDLIRDILLIIEDKSIPGSPLRNSEFEKLNTNLETFFYHLQLLDDAGFIEANLQEGCTGFLAFQVFRLTNDGCEYLDSVRDPKIYESIKKKTASLANSVSLEIVKQIGTSLILTKLNL